MKNYPRSATYPRDLLGRGGRQFSLPWGPGKTISTVQAAERLNLNYDTVRAMCENGEIQGWRLRERRGSPWRVSVESVEDFIAKKIADYDISDPAGQARASLPNARNAADRRSK